MRLFLLTLLLTLLLTQCRPTTAPLPTAVMPTASATPTPVVGVTLITLAAPTAVVRHTTPTPLPTATATPTTTPIHYSIVAGDTLLAIAIDRGTTVEEITGLNPGIRPAQLQIGQVIVLPPPATAVFQTAEGTPIPLQVQIRRVNVFRTPLDSLWVLGEVLNEGERPVENVQVEISLADSGGALLATAVTWLAPPVVAPGQAAPFAILFSQPPAEFAEPVTAVIGGQTVGDLGSRYLEFTVEEATLTAEDNRALVEGQVINTGQATAVNISLVVTFYDSQGKVTGYREIRLPGPLTPGDSLPFLIEATLPGGRARTLQMAVQAVREDG
jgi:LysM repeat protein